METPAFRKETPARGSTPLRRAAALVLALQAAGCADLQHEPRAQAEAPGSALARAEREATMNSRWRNRPLSELVRTLGKPMLTMDIPGGGTPPGFVVVYRPDAATGCIDAFAVTLGRDPVVRLYQCR